MNNKFNLEIKMKEFILDNDTIIINFPKREYILKDKIETTSLEILELIFLANNTNNNEYIDIILSKISMLDFYLEKSYKRKYINKKVLERKVYELTLITKMIYGWKNYVRDR
ncbi:MAG: four helix bundle protein [bacterium]|nr:four helix bundle protein [bacterium]